ncbi:ferredoxin [Pinisolibacter aquiterrae]|uniref:ferredoxin n=1 Tax=Pinisolibacter aquiterrae TaxID=2815579 RepID=UPI001C3CC957|nr:ferredoxin [Pinisolibacter aquiterrae]MBV5264638.1 ferredoxin [Pinisolibacter aquiterrae]MCC8233407.1 ferredoxin [Pinisolibacter aquiterrae]
MNPSNEARARIEAAIVAAGLTPRGVVRPGADDGVPDPLPGRPARSLILIGWRGRVGWSAFAASPERRDGGADPLDRWSRRVIGGLAADLGLGVLFPFGGPPWWPFQRWGARAEGLTASPLGLSIDAEVGLWHGWRGALVSPEDLGAEAPPQTGPCATCATRSCLVACPADAFGPAGFAAGRCRTFLEGHAGGLCRTDGCRARDACPVGRAHRYAPDQIRFLMAGYRATLEEISP